MERSIAELIPQFNKNISSTTVVGNVTTRFIPDFHKRLLKVFYDDRIEGIEKSPRSIKSLGFRFNRDPKYISRCLRDLEEWKFLESDPHGSGIKKRWISFEAFCELDIKNTTQITNQIEAIPYIDLSEKELIKYKILEHQQICAQLDDPTLETDTKLSIFLEAEKVSPTEQVRIKTQFRASPIGPIRKENILNRMIAQSRKRLIGSKRKYLMTCLANEEKEIKSLFHIFKGKINNINLYSQL